MTKNLRNKLSNTHKKKGHTFKNKKLKYTNKKKQIGKKNKKTYRYKGAGTGSSRSKKSIEDMSLPEKAVAVKKIFPTFAMPKDESLKEILNAIKSLGVDKGNIAEKGELINLLDKSMTEILNTGQLAPITRSIQTPTPLTMPSVQTPSITPSREVDEVENIEKMRQKFNIIINNVSSSANGFSETLEYMTPLEKIEAIKRISPDLAKTLGIDKDLSKMKNKEIKEVLNMLQLDYTNAVDKESLLELFGKVGQNAYLDKVLNDILITRKGRIDKKAEEQQIREEEERRVIAEKKRTMLQKLDDILSGKIHTFGFNEVREILEHMTNAEKIEKIKLMSPKLGDMLDTNVTRMDNTELLSFVQILGLTKPRGVTDRNDLERFINYELNRIGANKEIDKMFVDILNKLVTERDQKKFEEEKKYMEDKKKYEEDKKKYDEQERTRQAQARQESLRKQQEQKQIQRDQIRDSNGKIWNISYDEHGRKYYWDPKTNKSTWIIPGIPPPPTSGYQAYVYNPHEEYHRAAREELESIPRHLRHGENYNPKTFADLPNNTWE